jgi:hypothetical protein
MFLIKNKEPPNTGLHLPCRPPLPPPPLTKQQNGQDQNNNFRKEFDSPPLSPPPSPKQNGHDVEKQRNPQKKFKIIIIIIIKLFI